MKNCKYDFTKPGIKTMEQDALDLIFSALDGTNPDFDISELDFKVTIGNLQIEIPCMAYSFDILFGALLEIEEEDNL